MEYQAPAIVCLGSVLAIVRGTGTRSKDADCETPLSED